MGNRVSHRVFFGNTCVCGDQQDRQIRLSRAKFLCQIKSVNCALHVIDNREIAPVLQRVYCFAFVIHRRAGKSQQRELFLKYRARQFGTINDQSVLERRLYHVEPF